VFLSVVEALAKYKTVDEDMDDIRNLSLEDYKVKENNSDLKKMVDETEGWKFVSVLPSQKILIKKG